MSEDYSKETKNEEVCPVVFLTEFIRVLKSRKVVDGHMARKRIKRIVSLTETYKTFNARWLPYVPPSLKLVNPTFCPHSVFMCVVWI
jgi:hypothetical protein